MDMGYGDRYRVVLSSRGAVIGALAQPRGFTAGLGLWLTDAKVDYGPGASGETVGAVFVPWTSVAYVQPAGEEKD